MKSAVLTFKGKKHPLVYNIAAMFEIENRHGDNWIDKMQERTKEGFEVLADIAAIMNESYAAAKKTMGFTKIEVISADEIKNKASAGELRDIVNAVVTGINLGLSRDIDDGDEEVDLVMQEIEKKTEEKG